MKFSFLKQATDLSSLKQLLLIVISVNVIPFIYSTDTLDPVLHIRFIALSILGALLVSILLFQNVMPGEATDYAITCRAIFPLVLVYTFLAGFSLLQSVNLVEGIFEWLKFFSVFAFFYMASLSLAHNNQGHLWLTRSMILTALMLSVIGVSQYHQIAFADIPGNHAIYATMANKNLFASALFLTLPFIVYGILTFRGVWLNLSRFSLAGVVYAIALSESRAVWGAILIGSIASALVCRAGYQKLKLRPFGKKFYLRRIRWATISVFIACLVAVGSHSTSNQHACIFAGILTPSETITQKSRLKPILSLSTLHGRLQLWRTSVRMIKTAPLEGIGIGQWKIVAPAYGEKRSFNISFEGLRHTRAQRPHNDFLWIFSELGTPGIVSYLLFLGLLIYYGLRSINKSRLFKTKLYVVLMLSGLIGFLVISCVSFPKERIFHNIVFMLIAAGIVSVYHQTVPMKKAVNSRIFIVLNLVLCLMLIFGGIIGHARYQAERQAKKAVLAFADKDWPMVIQSIGQIDSRVYNIDPTSTPFAWYRGIARLSLGRSVEGACQDFKYAHDQNPYHAHVIHHHAICDRLKQQFDFGADYRQSLAVSHPFYNSTQYPSLYGHRIQSISQRIDRRRWN